MSNNILIISHFFPPIPGVGGRRWTKFVKYLTKKDDINIHVISAKNNIKNIESSFVSELSNIDFKHTQLDSNYPKYLELLDYSQPNLFRKVMFRVQLFLLKKRVKGNYWDFSVLWKTHFNKTIPEIITNEKINTLIISGTPFRYTKFAVDLKDTFPNLNIVLDYRDPWNDFNDPYPISEDRHQYERDLEREVLKKVDKIITVSEFQKKLIITNEPESAPVFVIPNGFDEDDYPKALTSENKSEKIKLLHFGTLHVLKDYYWIPFFNAIKTLKINHPSIYNKIQVELVGYCPKEILNYIKELDISVKAYGMLDPFEAYDKLNQADVALWFKYDGSPGDFATKFGDYISTKKFMWTFSVKGAVTDYIEKYEIGKVFYRNEANLEERIYNSLVEIEDKESRVFNPNYDPSDLQIRSLTDKLLQVLGN